MENLKKRLDEAEKIQHQKVEEEEEEEECLSSPLEVIFERRGGEQGRVSHNFSRALSETIQALEESICIATPGRHSFGTWLETVSPSDLEAARVSLGTI